MTRRKHYHVHVVELSKDVLLKARFMRSNPSYLHGKPCVYVGMTRGAVFRLIQKTAEENGRKALQNQ